MVIPLSGATVMALLFGKLPAHGDFVTRGVAAAERSMLDAWLSASLAAAREALGDAFDARYDQAQPWRAEGAGVSGAIALSQDAAGRRFPLLLLAGAGRAAACEDLLYRAIAERWDVDAVTAAAESVPEGAVTHWFGPGGGERSGAMPPDLIAGMLA